MQIGMGRTTGFYLVEVIAERFDRLPEDEKTKTIIHELMHIPSTFGGGFKHHHIVNERSVELAFREYKKRKGETRWF
jgi:predicted metallopeptidase